MKINGNGNHHIKQNKSTLNTFHVFPLYERFRRKTIKVKEEQREKEECSGIFLYTVIALINKLTDQ